MKKLVILLVLLAAAGTAAWLIYRKTPSGPEDKAVLYGNVDLRQVDLEGMRRSWYMRFTAN